MKKGVVILLLGLLVSTAAFSGLYCIRTANYRKMLQQPQPELAWLQKEFNLSDAELARITQLHDAYLPQCAERCARIAQQNERLEELLSHASSVTPQIQALLAERAKTRAECESEMLTHFLEVSRTMPPEEGRRYLEWVERQTFLNGQGMEALHHFEDTKPPGQAPHHTM